MGHFLNTKKYAYFETEYLHEKLHSFKGSNQEIDNWQVDRFYWQVISTFEGLESATQKPIGYLSVFCRPTSKFIRMSRCFRKTMVASKRHEEL